MRPSLAVALTTLTALLTALVAGCSPSTPTPTPELVVFVAASAGDAMKEAAAEFTRRSGRAVSVHPASSSTLAKQVEEGAVADLFLSADERWMDELERSGHLVAGSRIDLLTNDLVLVARRGAPGAAQATPSATMDRTAPPAALTSAARIAVGDPSHVPAGRYAEDALRWLGCLEAVTPRFVTAQDVRATLRLVELGEADVGIVYATDARSSDAVVVVATFPAESHTPIHYPLARLTGSREGAEALQAFLVGDAARAAFTKAGFGLREAP